MTSCGVGQRRTIIRIANINNAAADLLWLIVVGVLVLWVSPCNGQAPPTSAPSRLSSNATVVGNNTATNTVPPSPAPTAFRTTMIPTRKPTAAPIVIRTIRVKANLLPFHFDLTVNGTQPVSARLIDQQMTEWFQVRFAARLAARGYATAPYIPFDSVDLIVTSSGVPADRRGNFIINFDGSIFFKGLTTDREVPRDVISEIHLGILQDRESLLTIIRQLQDHVIAVQAFARTVVIPTLAPTRPISSAPSRAPLPLASEGPSRVFREEPTAAPSLASSVSAVPSHGPTQSRSPTDRPTLSPTAPPTLSFEPSSSPRPSSGPTAFPSDTATLSHAPTSTAAPTVPDVSRSPTRAPSGLDSDSPSLTPRGPTIPPSDEPSASALPTHGPTKTNEPTVAPTVPPTLKPSSSLQPSVSVRPSRVPTDSPTDVPTVSLVPSVTPSDHPSSVPTITPEPSSMPSDVPSSVPSWPPSDVPSSVPTPAPSIVPTISFEPTGFPSGGPSAVPTISRYPTREPTKSVPPTISYVPSITPSMSPTYTSKPSSAPSIAGSQVPSAYPSYAPTRLPSTRPTPTLTGAVEPFLRMVLLGVRSDLNATQTSKWERMTSNHIRKSWNIDLPSSPVFMGPVETTFRSQSRLSGPSFNGVNTTGIQPLEIVYQQSILYDLLDPGQGFVPSPSLLFTMPFQQNALPYLHDLLEITGNGKIIVVGSVVAVAQPTQAPMTNPPVTNNLDRGNDGDDDDRTVVITVFIVVAGCLSAATALLVYLTRKDDMGPFVGHNYSDDENNMNTVEVQFVDTQQTSQPNSFMESSALGGPSDHHGDVFPNAISVPASEQGFSLISHDPFPMSHPEGSLGARSAPGQLNYPGYGVEPQSSINSFSIQALDVPEHMAQDDEYDDFDDNDDDEDDENEGDDTNQMPLHSLSAFQMQVQDLDDM